MVLVQNCQQAKACKRYNSSNQAKKYDVSDVCKELLSLHVKAAGKDDRRQAEVEKEVVTEFHQVCKLSLTTLLECPRDTETNQSDQAGFVTKRQISLVLEGFKTHVDDQHAKDDNDTFVEGHMR